MSSHREAPEISKDPVADNADVYAFVSPDNPGTVTIISNFVPLQGPGRRTENFFSFGDDVLYSIYIDNDGACAAGDRDVSVPVLDRVARSEHVPLYNTGPIHVDHLVGLEPSPELFGPTRIDGGPPGHGKSKGQQNQQGQQGQGGQSGGPAWGPAPSASTNVLGSGLALPAVQHRAALDPELRVVARLGRGARAPNHGESVFCGQRADPFYVDLGSVFDLANLRPFENLHNQFGMNVFSSAAAGVNGTNNLNIHTIAIQVPITSLTSTGTVPLGLQLQRRPRGVLERREPAQGAGARELRRKRRRIGPLGPGLAAREPALQRGDRPGRPEGRLERRQPGGRLRVPGERAASRGRGAAPRPSTRTSSPTWRRSTRPAGERAGRSPSRSC